MTWEWFTEEYKPDGKIAHLSSNECQRAFMKTTNDDNEGALGAYRVGARRAPSMTLAQMHGLCTRRTVQNGGVGAS
jgi:hypothetical protein